MSEVITITDPGELQDLIDTEESLVVKFTAPSFCAPCRQLAPHYAALADVDDSTFVSVDLDDNPWAQGMYEIMSVPTLKMYRNGEFVKDLKGRTLIQLQKEINNA